MSLNPKEIEARAVKMTPPSHSALRLIELTGRDDYALDDVTRIVESDHALTAGVLKMVNSPVMGIRNPISTVQRAISFLGERMVVGIAVGICAPQVFNRPLAGYEGEAGALWAHSLRAAIAARELAPYLAEPVQGELAFTAGIIHDIGKSALSPFLDGFAADMASWVDSGELDAIQAEERAVGTNHCRIGALLARSWKIPEPMPGIIRHHHHPSEADPKDRPLAYLVHLGDMLAMMGGTGTGYDTMGYRIDPGYVDYIDIDTPGLEQLVVDTTAEFEKVNTALFGRSEEE
jgi:putative nucleotidyltransferase with HDIG domain